MNAINVFITSSLILIALKVLGILAIDWMTILLVSLLIPFLFWIFLIIVCVILVFFECIINGDWL